MGDKSNRGLGRILIRCSLIAKQRLTEMAAADGLAASVWIHRHIMGEWLHRQEHKQAEALQCSEADIHTDRTVGGGMTS